MAVLWGNYNLMGTNPASVNMANGDIILNMNTFPYLDRFTQKFIIEHERAHYLQQTDSEEQADRTALQKLYKTEHRSLKKSVKALVDFLGDEDSRIETIYNEALNLDRMNQELFRNRRSPFRNADGDGGGVGENAPQNSRSRGRGDGTNQRFVTVGGYVFSIGELAIIALLLIAVLRKK